MLAVARVLLLATLGALWLPAQAARPDIAWMRGGFDEPIWGMATTSIPGGDDLVVSVDASTLVRIHRLSDGMLLRTFRAFNYPAVYSLAVSPIGDTLAIRGQNDDGQTLIRIFGIGDGQLRATIVEPTWQSHFPGGVSYSPDGLTLVSNGPDMEGPRLWRVSDGALLDTIAVGTGGFAFGVTFVSFSPDGQWLVGDLNHASCYLALYRLEDGELRHFGTGSALGCSRAGGGSAASMSPDGQHVVVTDHLGVRVYATASAVPDAPHLPSPLLEANEYVTLSAAFSPDSSRLAIAALHHDVNTSEQKASFLVYTTSDWTQIEKLTNLDIAAAPGDPHYLHRPITSFAATGALLTAHRDLRAWRASDWAMVRNVSETTSGSSRIAYDGNWVAIGNDATPGAYQGSVMLRRAVDGEASGGSEFGSAGSTLPAALRHDGATSDDSCGISALAYSPLPHLLASSCRGSGGQGDTRMWVLSEGLGTLHFTVPFVADSIAFSPDGDIMALAGGDTVELRSALDGGFMHAVTDTGFSKKWVGFTTDGHFVVLQSHVDADGPWHFSVYRTEDAGWVRSFGQATFATEAAISPDGQLVAVPHWDQILNHHYVRVYRVADGSLVHSLLHAPHTGELVHSVAFSRDGSLLASQSNGPTPLRLWRVRTGKPLAVFDEEAGGNLFVLSPIMGGTLAFGPDVRPSTHDPQVAHLTLAFTRYDSTVVYANVADYAINETAVKSDFDGDGRSDVLWRHGGEGGTGQNYVYPMNGTAILAQEGFLRTVADLDWAIVGVGDFDGDGKADILWRHSSSGENYIYFMQGRDVASEGYLRTVADLNWEVAGVGDFDGDGKDDILWRNAASGENYLYFMDGLSIKPSEGYLRTVSDLSWRIAGAGDFDGDGRADILWRNELTGENYLYPMEGLAIKAGEGYLRTVTDLNWQVAGVGDFDGDGMSDIAWRNSASGENYLYPMNGTAIKPTEGYLRTVAVAAWRIAAIGDYDGDGRSDIFWRNTEGGENYVYPMEGTAIKPSEGYVRTVADQGWQVVSR